MHKQHEREDFVHTEGPSYKSHFIVHDEDYERYVLLKMTIEYMITNNIASTKSVAITVSLYFS